LQQFDFWVHGTGYVNPRLNVNGVITEHTGHQSVVLRDYALEFLADAAGRDQPFLLLFTPFAPHSPAIPAPGDEDLYPDLPPLRPPSHNEADVSDKPAWVKNEQPLTASEVQALDDLWKRQLQTLHSTDQAIDAVLTALEADGALDNTLTVFTSDNGYLFGEHRTQKKGVLYEEAIRVPLAIRYAPLIDGSRDEPKLTANIDLAPTIYELAGIPIPSGVDGRSLVPLLQDGTVAWRDDLLLEHFGHAPGFVGVHTGEWVYVERPGDIPELYDLTTDPYQLTNLSQNPAYDAMEAELRARLAAYDRGGGGSSSSNRILNGGFEQDADANGRPDAWTMNVRFSRSSTIVHGEIFAGRHSATDNAGYTIAQTIGGLVPARTYRVSGWINIPATSDSFTFKLQVRWLNASAATIKTATVKTYKGATAGWNEATASLVAPPGTAQAQVRMVVSSLKAAIYVDDISLLD
jgi:hypothetical protein